MAGQAVLSLVLVLCGVALAQDTAGFIRKPVIGILAQKSGQDLKEEGDAYIYEAYVKFIEQAGGLVVPIKTRQSDSYYKALFNKLNGVVFPGGAVSLVTSPFAHAASLFFNWSMEANDHGDFFPILGICLGFEELTVRRTLENKMQKCDGTDYAVPLAFSKDARESRLLRSVPDELYAAMATWNVTYNNHEYCMDTQTFRESQVLNKFYRIISTNTAKDGTEFVSTMEAYHYPFYGTQWHPEKNTYLWSHSNVNHSAESVQVTQYISNFFVNEARKSQHVYPEGDLEQAIIFNYAPTFMGLPSFHNIYFFKVHCWYPNWWEVLADGSGSMDLDGMLAAAMIIFLIVLLLFVLTKARVRRKDDPNIEDDYDTVPHFTT